MSPTICRTCLTVLRENSQSFFALENGIPGVATLREKLNCCIPELALDIIPNAVICTTCSTTLNLAYDFKTKCLDIEAKIRKYLQSIHDNYNENHIYYNQRRWSMGLKPSSTHEPQNASLNNSEEPVKQESEAYDAKETNKELFGDSPAETNVDSNEYDLHLKIKTETNSNEEINSASSSEAIENSLNNETEEFYNFTKTLHRLKDKNINRLASVYDQAREQFNLLKAVQTLAGQGTEININGMGISTQNQTLGEASNQLSSSNSSKDEEHMQNLNEKKNLEHYDCYYCSRSFDRLSLLKTHIISHTGVKPFSCNICGKGCSHKGELNNHMRTHTGEKPFKCSLCESSFSQISNMKIHMRTHTGEKPYKCDYCDKSFSHKCGVKVHMRTHTGERPYKCEICFKTYTHKKDLDDHMRTHTGEKYRCTICSKEITYKKNLSAHMFTHSLKYGNQERGVKKNKIVISK